MTKSLRTTIRVVAIAFLLATLLPHPLRADDPARIRKQLERMDRQFTPEGFLRAVNDRDVKAVKLFLAGGIDVKSRNSSNETALHLASNNDDAEMVSLLLKAGPDINAKDDRGKTPLLDSATNGQGTAKTIPLLLAAGADLAIRYQYGTSIVYEAANMDNAGTLLALIKAGAKLDAANDKGETPLFLAASMGRKVVTPLLIQAGANLNARDEDGETALIASATTGELESVRLLTAAKADASLADQHGRTALINAAGITSAQMQSFKIDDASVTRMVEILLAAGSDVKARSKLDATTPLIAAAREGHADAVALLLARKPPLNSKTDPDGYTALMEAAKAGHAEVVRLLLAAGADVKVKDRVGRTAATWAADYPEVVALLGGAPASSKPGSKSTAAMKTAVPAARAPGKTVTPEQKAEAQAKLEELGYRWFDESTFVSSATKGEVEAAQAFLDYGLSVDSKDSDDHTTTPLLRAASNDDSALGLFLIEHGANVNAKDQNGSTPLLLAASQCGQTALLKALLKAGADVNARAAGGATPFMMADVSSCAANAKVLKAAGGKK
ncbi:MAG: ankyrin repeat domain-containing protein [Thermoanaerobaculia bacterium]